jgi:hypothetical protein
MTDSDEDLCRSRRPDVEDRGWSSIDRVLGGRMVRKSGDAVCGLHNAQDDEERGFLGLASKPRSTISLSLASKSVATVSSRLISKPVAMVPPGLATKPMATVLMVWPQNH